MHSSKKFIFKILLFSNLIVLSFANLSFAQRGEIGIGLGATNYKGDLAKMPHLLSTRIGGELFYRNHLGEAVSWRIGGFLGLLSGDDALSSDAFQNARNYSFSGTAIELNTVLEYHFFNYRGRKAYPRYSPYLFGGVAASHLSINSNPEPSDDAEDLPFINLVLPYGVGVKYVLSKKFILGIELGTRQTFTDYLDRVSAQNATPKFQRGNPENNDKYYFLSFSLSYRFNSVKCPDPSPRRSRGK